MLTRAASTVTDGLHGAERRHRFSVAEQPQRDRGQGVGENRLRLGEPGDSIRMNRRHRADQTLRALGTHGGLVPRSPGTGCLRGV
ncbi:hypothetical protein E3O51_13945 [Cryobacterium sp. MDB2-10]|nr:hypothetical protein E3O51_13945 [Cryobacterium sp. MDB2-10]